MHWQESESSKTVCANHHNLPEQQYSYNNINNNITTPEQLDRNTRFGILSHGMQDDPIYNYGNCAALELFDQTLETLCQTPSRYSTVESLMEDREQLIRKINDVGYGTILNAVRTTPKGKLFVIQKIWIWHVYHDNGRRIGLAALYDRSQVQDYNRSIE
jgi:MEKHLA domain